MIRTSNIPQQATTGTIARLAIQCTCPDAKTDGSFLFIGDSHRTENSRVTPIFTDVLGLFEWLKDGWKYLGLERGIMRFEKA